MAILGKNDLKGLFVPFWYLLACFNSFAPRILGVFEMFSKAAKTWAFLYSLFTCSTGARLSRAKETAASHLCWKKFPPVFSGISRQFKRMLILMLMAYIWNIWSW